VGLQENETVEELDAFSCVGGNIPQVKIGKNQSARRVGEIQTTLKTLYFHSFFLGRAQHLFRRFSQSTCQKNASHQSKVLSSYDDLFSTKLCLEV
jgi:hypothetical protein